MKRLHVGLERWGGKTVVCRHAERERERESESERERASERERELYYYQHDHHVLARTNDVSDNLWIGERLESPAPVDQSKGSLVQGLPEVVAAVPRNPARFEEACLSRVPAEPVPVSAYPVSGEAVKIVREEVLGRS